MQLLQPSRSLPTDEAVAKQNALRYLPALLSLPPTIPVDSGRANEWHPILCRLVRNQSHVLSDSRISRKLQKHEPRKMMPCLAIGQTPIVRHFCVLKNRLITDHAGTAHRLVTT
ncbi:uncharacterized protein METZ01_LOCUS130169, partial [marine metagenome]